MSFLIVAATPFEIAPLQQWLSLHPREDVEILVTGVGMLATSFALTKRLSQGPKPTLVLNLGIAGAISREYALGDVVNVLSEQVFDLGVEEADGTFRSMFKLQLVEADEKPFRSGRLWNDAAAQFHFLPHAHAISVNKVHGTASSIANLLDSCDADIENMEGAAVFYTCLQLEQQFLEIRSISNYVEPRNRDAWNIPLAIQRLNETAIQIVMSSERKEQS